MFCHGAADDLNPNNADSHAFLAAALNYAGRHEEGLVEMETAIG